MNISSDQFNHLAGGIESIAKIIALIAGGWWAYNRFVRQRDNYPLIEFSVDFNFIGRQGGWWIVELTALIENKGKVQHRCDDFAFDLSVLFPDDEIETKTEYSDQVFFPHRIMENSWLPPRTQFFFIDPGTKAKYSHVTRIPEAARFAILHSWFSYDNQKASYAAERTVRVPLHEPKDNDNSTPSKMDEIQMQKHTGFGETGL